MANIEDAIRRVDESLVRSACTEMVSNAQSCIEMDLGYESIPDSTAVVIGQVHTARPFAHSQDSFLNIC